MTHTALTVRYKWRNTVQLNRPYTVQTLNTSSPHFLLHQNDVAQTAPLISLIRSVHTTFLLCFYQRGSFLLCLSVVFWALMCSLTVTWKRHTVYCHSTPRHSCNSPCVTNPTYSSHRYSCYSYSKRDRMLSIRSSRSCPLLSQCLQPLCWQRAV